ncbi:hypothetical protein H4V97_000715 [Flavobacterium sp. CG_23.5]|uniref:hypothetical protein n=1 Tax=Flavobacterium sp. CG_23.5 TaxID=2760708 RepID=UPI001AEAA104|nr:hypothetical protein [Flavobacterium sp. CG_23.5]MBP2282397.1 hypothetical protein [Flavobacterium sp. CG_23.5]
MIRYLFVLLLTLRSITSVYSQHKIKEIFSERLVPFVEIYSENGDLIGMSDNNGIISSDLENKIYNTTTKSLTFVNPIYKTSEISIEIFKNTPIISLNRIVTELEEVVIKPKPKVYEYLKLKGYFRSIQINEDKPHYFIDGIVEYYISSKSDKIKMKIIYNRSFENKSIKQISPNYWFMVAGVPSFNDCIKHKNLKNEYNLKLTNNQNIIILDKETNLEKGTIINFKNNLNLQLEIISNKKPKVMKMFGMETDYNNYTINAIYNSDDALKMNLENLTYFKEIRSYDIKRKQKDKFQKVEATHEFFLLEKNYVNEINSKGFDNFYTFKKPSDFEGDYWKNVENEYFQLMPKSLEKYIQENLKLIEK